MRKKFLIMAPPYSENDGGGIVLHKLCDELNRLGCDAYLIPMGVNFEFDFNHFSKSILKIAGGLSRHFKKLTLNPIFKTPVMALADVKKLNLDDWLVVYPETVFGNPVQARHVVRWFLHHPGFHTGKIFFGTNELYFKYHAGIVDYTSVGSRLSAAELKIVHYPLNYYNVLGASANRQGTAYCIRKGKGKPIVHDVSDSILIDGKSHAEIAAIFKRVKQFISYDTYTAYSILAPLCGCDSVIIPDEGVTEDAWLPDPASRYGLAYGFENVEASRLSRLFLAKKIQDDLGSNSIKTSIFISECERYFS